MQISMWSMIETVKGLVNALVVHTAHLSMHISFLQRIMQSVHHYLFLIPSHMVANKIHSIILMCLKVKENVQHIIERTLRCIRQLDRVPLTDG